MQVPGTDDTDSETEEYKFAWDEPSVQCPPEWPALWQRAKAGDKKIQ